MMEYNISEILKIIGSGNRSLIGDGNLKISRLLTDSRSLTYPSETLFFALTTQSGDGHRYLRQLYDKGVKNFVVSAVPDDMKSLEDANFIVTDNPLVALHALAGYHRNRFDVPVIAITGSRGKTIVKEWLNSLLQDDIVITRSPRSYNSQIGVPLSVWELNERTQLAIFEAGISMPGEMARLKDIIRPEIGIFTNIGTAHSSGFLSIEDKCREKASLLSDCRCVIYNSDDELINRCMPDVPVKLGWSRIDSTSPLFVEKVESGGGMSRLTFCYLGGEQQTVEIPFANEHDIENAIHCLATMLYLDIPADVIAERMARLTPVGTRLEVIEGVNGCLLIHDSYTSDFNSLSPALDFMRRRAVADRSLTAVISDLSCGEGTTDEDYARMAELLAMAGVSRLIGNAMPDVSILKKNFSIRQRSFLKRCRYAILIGS